MDENRLNEMWNFFSRLKKALPEPILQEMERQSEDFYKHIRDNKPKKVISNKAMQKLYEATGLPANKIDDLLLENGIGDDKAVYDYLELLEKNKKNIPVTTGDEGKKVNDSK